MLENSMVSVWKGSFIKLKQSGRVASIVLDRADKANAYNRRMLEELEEAIERSEKELKSSVIIFMSASKKYFCAGADLEEISRRKTEDILNLKSQELFERISNMRQATIAAVSGDTAGGGLELALACDIRIATINSRFWFPELQLGLLPVAGGIRNLPVVVGISVANDMILSGRKLTAKEALKFGLVSRNIPEKNFYEQALNLGGTISKQDDTVNYLAKKILNQRRSATGDNYLDNVVQVFLTLKKRGALESGGEK